MKPEFERPLRRLLTRLNQGLDRQNGAGPSKDGNLGELGFQFQGRADLLLTAQQLIPVAFGQLHVVAGRVLLQNRGHQQLAAQHILVGQRDQARFLRKLEEHRAHQGHSVSRTLFHGGIKIRKQSIAKLDGLLARRLVLGAIHPGFALASGAVRMIAKQGIQGAQLHPAGQQGGGGVATVASDIGPGQAKAGNPQIEQLRHREAQVVPTGRIIPGPGGRVAPTSGETRTGQHEGAKLGAKFLQTFEGRPAVEHAKDVVDFTLVGASPGQLMANIQRHRLIGPVESGRFIHVIPDPAHSGQYERPVQPAPPGAHLRVGKVGPGDQSGPHLAVIHLAIGTGSQIAPGQRLIVGGISGMFGQVGVKTDHRLEVERLQFANQFLEVGKELAVHCEGAGPVFVVPVQVEYITGNGPLAQFLGHLAHGRFGNVATPALLISQRPERRQRHASEQGRILAEDVFGTRSGHDVIVELAAFASERIGVAELLLKLELAAVGVVEVESPTAALAEAQIERHAFIQRVGRLLPHVSVAIPQRTGLVAPIESPWFIAQTEVMVIQAARVHYTKSLPLKGDRQTIPEQQTALAVLDAQSGVLALQLQAKSPALQLPALGGGQEPQGSRGRTLFDGDRGLIPGLRRPPRAGPDPHHLGSAQGDPQTAALATDLDGRVPANHFFHRTQGGLGQAGEGQTQHNRQRFHAGSI